MTDGISGLMKIRAAIDHEHTSHRTRVRALAEHRQRIVQGLLDSGATLRGIAFALDVSAQTVHRWATEPEGP